MIIQLKTPSGETIGYHVLEFSHLVNFFVDYKGNVTITIGPSEDPDK